MEELKEMKPSRGRRPRVEVPQEGQHVQNNEWILVAMAIDRLFIVVYVVLTIVLVVTLFVKHPSVKG